MIASVLWSAAVFGVSVAICALFCAHVLDATYGYRRHHDDRAAIELLIALTLAVASLGLTCSAFGRFAPDHTLGVALGELGLGIVRGALFTTASVLFLVDRRVLQGGRR